MTSLVAGIVISKRFVAFQVVAATASLTIALIFRLELLVLAWVPLFTAIFISGGWFYRQLNSMLGWPSLFVFVLGAFMPVTISRSIAPIGLLAYLGALLAVDGLESKKRENRRRVGSSRIFFSFLVLYSTALLLTTYSMLSVNPLFWIPAVLFALAGWFFPEINIAIGSGPKGSEGKGIASYAAIMGSGIAFAVYLGPTAAPGLLSWVLALLLMVFLRASFLTQRPELLG